MRLHGGRIAADPTDMPRVELSLQIIIREARTR